MDKFNDWFDNNIVESNITSSRKACKLAYEAGQQSRQAEIDKLTKALEIKSKFLEEADTTNKFLNAQLDGKDKRIEEVVKSIDSFFDNQVGTPTQREYANFIAELLGILRDNSDINLNR